MAAIQAGSPATFSNKMPLGPAQQSSHVLDHCDLCIRLGQQQ